MKTLIIAAVLCGISSLNAATVTVQDAPTSSFTTSAGVAIDFDASGPSGTGVQAVWSPGLVAGQQYSVDSLTLYRGSGNAVSSIPYYLVAYRGFTGSASPTAYIGASTNTVVFASFAQAAALTWSFSNVNVIPETNRGTGGDIVYFVLQPAPEAITSFSAFPADGTSLLRLETTTANLANSSTAVIHGNAIQGVYVERGIEFSATLTPIPEAGSVALSSLGLLALFRRRR